MENNNWQGNVKLNKNILKYSERVFMGLNTKQTICGVLAIASAIGVYFFCNKILGDDIAIILCALVVVPIAAIGFVTYNGMTFLQLVKTMIFHYCMPNKLLYKSRNYLKELIRLNKYIETKEGKEKNVKHI